MIPVQEVYLYEDRAQIAHKGSVRLKAGNNTIIIEDLSPLLILKSVQVTIKDPTVQLNFVETKQYQKEDTEPDTTKPKDANARLLKEKELIREVQRKLRSAKAYKKMYQQTVREMFLDVSMARGSKEDWTHKETLLREKKQLAVDQYLEAQSHLEKIQKENQEHNVDTFTTTQYRYFTRVAIGVYVSEPRDIDLSVDYLLANACWRPSHRIALLDEEIEFDIGAMIWQNTGMDWNNVQLFFSTERSSRGKNLPTLQADILSIQRTDKTVHITERDQAIHQLERGVVKEDAMPGIDAGGEDRVLRAVGRISIPSNGKPYFSKIHTMRSAFRRQLLMVSDQVGAVVLKTIQSNSSAFPILSGPVELLKNGSYFGRSKLDFVSAGENFEVAWGAIPEVRVNRHIEEMNESASFFTGERKEIHMVDLYLSNIGGKALDVHCIERIPVSELSQVKVSPPRTQNINAHASDIRFDAKQGFLSWTQHLPVSGTIKNSYQYTITKESSVKG